MSYRSDGGGPAAPASGHCAVAAPQPSPHMAVAPATRRDSGGAEARAPIRRRRAHSHQPGLCSDKWGASCPDVWSRGPRASPRQRGSCLGRRRSYGGPGLTKPVQPLSPPQRGASSRTCHRPQRPRNPPLQGRRASDPATTHRHSREGGNPPGGAGCHPLCATARADPASLPPHGCRASLCHQSLVGARISRATPTHLNRRDGRPTAPAGFNAPSELPCPSDPAVQAYLAALRRQQRRTKRMAAGEMHTALLEVMQRAPTGSNPLLAYLRKTPPGPTGPARDSDRSQSKEDHPTASARVPSPGNNCCFTPRPASKDDKKHKAILQREINHTALLLTEAAKPSNEVPRNPPPTKPSRPRSADARSLGGTPRRPGAAPGCVGGGPW